MANLKQNLARWAIVVPICAAPSFVVAMRNGYSLAAMGLGVFLIIIVYAVANSSAMYRRIVESRPRFEKALKIVYWLKIVLAVLSIITSIVLREAFSFITIMPDMYAGLISAITVQSLVGKVVKFEFFPTLATVLLEAVIVSVFLVLLACVFWGLMVLFKKIIGDRKDA